MCTILATKDSRRLQPTSEGNAQNHRFFENLRTTLVCLRLETRQRPDSDEAIGVLLAKGFHVLEPFRLMN
jgi:hypothetical protein